MVFGFMLAALVYIVAADAVLRQFGCKMIAAQETALDSRSLVVRVPRTI